MNGTLTDVRGLSVGHWTDREAADDVTTIGAAAASVLAQAVPAAVH